MTYPLIQARGLGFSSFGKAILFDVDIEVRPGEIVTMIGPNGAGKSTLVRLLLGLLAPDSGSIERQENLTVGYMPQKLSIDSTLPLSVERFVLLAENKLFKHDKSRLQECLDLTGVGKLKKQAMQSLSGGELQRVLLARALFRKPDLLVLDEPVQGVDISGQSALYQLISNIRDQWQCGVLMISHDLHLVMASTDRVVCLNQHVCCEGHPDSVSSNPEFLKMFGEHSGLAVVPYSHEHDHSHDHF